MVEEIQRRLPRAGTIEIVPSILGANFARLADELALLEAADIKLVHLDIMDGHFVPNITIGPPVIAKLREHSNLVFDSHLMISEPDKYIKQFARAGVNNITFHIEATNEPLELVKKIHSLGCTAGITLNPETPVEAIDKVAPQCDMVLIMTVHPGFGGQKFLNDEVPKISRVRDIVGPDIRVEVDGGINNNTILMVVNEGADTLVVGNAIFSKADRIGAIESLRKIIKA
jgi:ribulose-phosphate 3-epimerase